MRESQWHGGLAHAEALLAEHPEIAHASIFTVCILGEADTVARLVASDPACATAPGCPPATPKPMP